MTASAIKQHAAPTPVDWRILVDDAWRTPEFRREFELATGLDPLVGGRREQDLQDMSGYTARYRDAFVDWATARLGLNTVAPSSVRRRLASGAG